MHRRRRSMTLFIGLQKKDPSGRRAPMSCRRSASCVIDCPVCLRTMSCRTRRSSWEDAHHCAVSPEPPLGCEEPNGELNGAKSSSRGAGTRAGAPGETRTPATGSGGRCSIH